MTFFRLRERRLGHLGIAIQQVRIIAERGDRDIVLAGQRANFIGPRPRHRGRIDVADPGVFAFGLAGGPTHQFDAAEAVFLGKMKDLLECQLRQYGGDKSQFHGGGGGPELMLIHRRSV